MSQAKARVFALCNTYSGRWEVEILLDLGCLRQPPPKSYARGVSMWLCQAVCGSLGSV